MKALISLKHSLIVEGLDAKATDEEIAERLRQQILEDGLAEYFSTDNVFITRCTDRGETVPSKQESFPCITLSRDDFETRGFDASGIPDDDMKQISRKIGEIVTAGGDYWLAIEEYGRREGLPSIVLRDLKDFVRKHGENRLKNFLFSPKDAKVKFNDRVKTIKAVDINDNGDLYVLFEGDSERYYNYEMETSDLEKILKAVRG